MATSKSINSRFCSCEFNVARILLTAIMLSVGLWRICNANKRGFEVTSRQSTERNIQLRAGKRRCSLSPPLRMLPCLILQSQSNHRRGCRHQSHRYSSANEVYVGLSKIAVPAVEHNRITYKMSADMAADIDDK